jgi:hypothetical protein
VNDFLREEQGAQYSACVDVHGPAVIKIGNGAMKWLSFSQNAESGAAYDKTICQTETKSIMRHPMR